MAKKKARTASVRIAEDLRVRAKVLAAKRRTTVFAILNEAIGEFLKRQRA